MATNLDDLITCPVCLDVYADPQMLPCMHTLCMKCAQGLATSVTSLLCPTCRSPTLLHQLKGDFKTLQLIEKHNQLLSTQQKTSEGLGNELCELCEEKESIYMCQKCQIITCQTCKRIHIKTTECTEDDSEPLTSLSDKHISQKQVIKGQLDMKLEQLEIGFMTAFDSCTNQKKKALDDVQTYQDEVIKACEKDRLRINKSAENYVNKITGMYQKLQNESQSLKEELSKTVAMKELKESMITIGNLRKRQESIDKVTFNAIQLTASVGKATTKPKCAAKVAKPSASKADTSLLQPLTTRKMYGKVTIHTAEEIQQIVQHNDNIYCMTNNSIELYNASNGAHMKSMLLQIAMLDVYRGMGLYNDKELIIAADSGLHRLHVVTGKRTTLNSEPHVAITIPPLTKSTFVTLRIKNGLIYVDQYTKKMQDVKSVVTDLKRENFTTTCAVMQGKLFICITGHHCVYQFDWTSGKVVKCYGSVGSDNPGQLSMPRICKADENSLLIADTLNNRLQMLRISKKNSTWAVLNIDSVVEPTTAVITEDGRLYVAGQKAIMHIG